MGAFYMPSLKACRVAGMEDDQIFVGCVLGEPCRRHHKRVARIGGMNRARQREHGGEKKHGA